VDIRPLERDAGDGSQDGARYVVHYITETAILNRPAKTVRARNVIVSAGVLGTLDLLLKCRDVNGSLPRLSSRLGEMVRSNSEAFVGAFSPRTGVDHAAGIAISSIIRADADTQIEPVRFSKGSSLIFWILSAPMIRSGGQLLARLGKILIAILRRPLQFFNLKFVPGLSQRGVALMIMQTKDNIMKLRLGRSGLTFFRRGLVAQHAEENRIPVDIDLGHQVARSFAGKIGGYPVGTVPEGILDVPTTAHMLGGCLMGQSEHQGVIDENFAAFNYPGLYIIDGSVVPANPGVNPSLTITALAEYAMSRMPAKS
jgi:cholesterol oxidase